MQEQLLAGCTCQFKEDCEVKSSQDGKDVIIEAGTYVSVIAETPDGKCYEIIKRGKEKGPFLNPHRYNVAKEIFLGKIQNLYSGVRPIIEETPRSRELNFVGFEQDEWNIEILRG